MCVAVDIDREHRLGRREVPYAVNPLRVAEITTPHRVWNRVYIFRVRSEIGYEKSHILVWNRVRVFRTGRHTPTQKYYEYPPPPPPRAADTHLYLKEIINWMSNVLDNPLSQIMGCISPQDYLSGACFQDVSTPSPNTCVSHPSRLLKGNVPLIVLWNPSLSLRCSVGEKKKHYPRRNFCSDVLGKVNDLPAKTR